MLSVSALSCTSPRGLFTLTFLVPPSHMQAFSSCDSICSFLIKPCCPTPLSCLHVLSCTLLSLFHPHLRKLEGTCLPRRIAIPEFLLSLIKLSSSLADLFHLTVSSCLWVFSLLPTVPLALRVRSVLVICETPSPHFFSSKILNDE